ncbi:MAG TPA: hypothetical protein DDZ51_09600 [Planctomycetaceae bacterium]|nr:hypothetical protein [Planctomycetaceae bacterium]
MGFYIRKSVKVGPFRFNLSKSGIGVSSGVPGFRIGTGPRGTYVHMGRGGVYYRKTLSSTSRKSPSLRTGSAGGSLTVAQVQSNSLPVGGQGTRRGAQQAAAPADIDAMVASSSPELIEDIRKRMQTIRTLPFAIIVAIGLFYLTISAGLPLAFLLALTAAVLVIAGFVLDKSRKSVVVMYEMDPNLTLAFQRVCEAFDSLSACGQLWYIAKSTSIFSQSSPGQSVHRMVAYTGIKDPPLVKTNVSVPSIAFGLTHLYLLPDQILVYGGGKVGTLSYEDVAIVIGLSSFVENGNVPADATVVSHTWRYARRDGGPDRRFSYNPRLAICSYDQVHISSQSGLDEWLVVSQVGVAERLRKSIQFLVKELCDSRNSASALAQSPAQAVSPSTVASSQRSGLPAGSTDIHQLLIEMMCFIMMADNSSTLDEVGQILSLAKKVKLPLSDQEVHGVINRYIAYFKSSGREAMHNRAMEALKEFNTVSRQQILVRCLELVASVDGQLTREERDAIDLVRLCMPIALGA